MYTIIDCLHMYVVFEFFRWMLLFDGLTVTLENLIKAAVIHMHSCITEREGYLNIIVILHVAPKQAWNISKSMFCGVGIIISINTYTWLSWNYKYLAHTYFPISIGIVLFIVILCSHYTLELCRAKELCWCWSVVDSVSTHSHYSCVTIPVHYRYG